MKRRQAFLLPAALGAWTGGSFGQPRLFRVGFLGGISPDSTAQQTQVDPFRQELISLGYVEGRNLEIHFRWAEGKPERLPGLAAELLRLNPDVFLAAGPAPAIALKNATTIIPVVAVGVNDPVAMGLVADYAHPGGNVTGISSFGAELVSKRLQLLKELVPAIKRAAILSNPATLSPTALAASIPDYERTTRLRLQVVEAGAPEQFEAAFDAMDRERAEGVLVLADATFWTHRARLHQLVQKHRLPSVWGGRYYLDQGGLASYQADWPAIFRRGASIVDRILKGAKPADTPFEQATKLELVINLKAAQAMGITVPQALLVAADEVIR